MNIAKKLQALSAALPPHVALVAVTKTHPVEKIKEAYDAGQRIFGENKVQELLSKYSQLPSDSEWHLIGHLQSNKVKYIAPFIRLIHAVDSVSLLKEIDKQARKCNRVIDCLLQIHIAREETKFGLSFGEAEQLIHSVELKSLTHIRIAGLMGMATNTSDEEIVRSEFRLLKQFYDKSKSLRLPNLQFRILSMGMSSDYLIAIEEGSNMVRLGSVIFGERSYANTSD